MLTERKPIRLNFGPRFLPRTAMTRTQGKLAGVLFLALSAGASGQNVQDQPRGAIAAPESGPITTQEQRPPGRNGILPVIMDARIGEHPDRTRFVVEVSDPFRVRVFTLTQPDRVVIDMPEVLWRL